MRKFVSVIVPTCNRRTMLKDCLESLFNQTYSSYEIIVVDSSTNVGDDVIQEYKSKSPCTLKYLFQQPRGPAAARNLGIKHATGEIICFIDDDCIADKHWIENLVAAFDYEEVGGVGGKIVASDPRTLVEKYASTFFNQEYLISVQSFIIGCNMAYRKDILDMIGGFDESFRFSEDNDIGIRVRLKGYELRYAPNAVVYHRHRTSLKGLIKQQYGYGKGHARLGKKYTSLPTWQLAMAIWVKLMWILATSPLEALNREKFAFRMLYTISTTSFLLGLIRGILFEEYPREKRIHEDLSFMRDYIKSVSIWRKVKSKLFT